MENANTALTVKMGIEAFVRLESIEVFVKIISGYPIKLVIETLKFPLDRFSIPEGNTC